jgi:transcriptional regulator with XRE-family HTH domain
MSTPVYAMIGGHSPKPTGKEVILPETKGLMLLKEIGKKLKEAREARNLSLRKAAEMIGVSHTYLDTLEKGRDPRTGNQVNPSAETLVQISKGYDIPIDELLPLDDEANEDDSLDFDAIAHSLQELRPEDRDAILHLIKRLARA